MTERSTTARSVTRPGRVGADVENVIGGAGNDGLVGSDVANTLDGGPGNDILAGGLGADVIAGGNGRGGRCQLRDAHHAATIRPDGTPSSGNVDDGPVGASDTVQADVEDAYGGSGDDTFDGNAQDNTFSGGAGADVMHGGGGEDVADYRLHSAGVTMNLDGTPRTVTRPVVTRRKTSVGSPSRPRPTAAPSCPRCGRTSRASIACSRGSACRFRLTTSAGRAY